MEDGRGKMEAKERRKKREERREQEKMEEVRWKMEAKNQGRMQHSRPRLWPDCSNDKKSKDLICAVFTLSA